MFMQPKENFHSPAANFLASDFSLKKSTASEAPTDTTGFCESTENFPTKVFRRLASIRATSLSGGMRKVINSTINHMHQVRICALFGSLIFLFPLGVVADTPPMVNVADSCTVIDTDGNSHDYSGRFLGICALAAAKEQGAISAYTLQNFSFGLFLQSLNGIVPAATEFWSISQNGTEASVGLSDMTVASGDILSFQLTDWSNGMTIGSPVQFTIAILMNTPAPSAPSGGTKAQPPPVHPFDLPAALEHLSSKQRSDGSFGSLLLTDWAAIAVGAAGELADTDMREKLRTYLTSASLSGSSATDLERRIMALEALGIDPYTPSTSLGASSTNYVDLLVDRFDGEQMGEKALVNDDIFAIFPLAHAGYGADDPMMRAILDTIVETQQDDGSWVSSIDLTAAAIQALAPYHGHPGVSGALSKAEGYLRGRQVASGGFGQSSFSTSWALQAIAALNQKPSDWNIFDITPLGALGNMQQGDGGVEHMSASDDTRIWATAYAIPAALARPWHVILNNFTRPATTPTYTAVVETTLPPSMTLMPVFADKISDTVPITVSQATSPEIASIATTSDGTSTAQVATAGQSANESNGVWLWLAGLFLVLGTGAYFVRGAK